MISSSFNDGWTYRPTINAFQEVMALFGEAAPYEPVTLPHDAMLRDGRDPSSSKSENAFFKPGAYDYRKTFFAPESWEDCAVALRFEGVYRDAAVVLNGEQIGHRPSGYAEFVLALDDQLLYGKENHLRVQARAYEDSRWYSGGGIYRNVTLLVGGPVHVVADSVFVSTPDLDHEVGLANVETAIANRTSGRRRVEILTEVIDRDGTVVGANTQPLTLGAGSVETITQRVYVNEPDLWSVDRPTLYLCRTRVLDAEVELDRSETTFGFRTIQVDPKRGLRINGERVDLRGACIHHDNGVLGAATITRADERRVELLKAAGFNAIRSAHNPLSRAVLDACDRVGMLVMDEAYDMWTFAKANHGTSLHFPTWWEADIDAMVRKDRNHPSVILYSIGNEIPELGNASGAALSRAMTARVRALDPTRLVTNGVNAMLTILDDLLAMATAAKGNDTAAPADATNSDTGINTAMASMGDMMPMLMKLDMVAEKTAESFAALDVAGYNYLDSRYEIDGDLFPNRVIVGTESGINAIVENWRLVTSLDHLIGDFCWTGWDYLGEVGIGRTRRPDDAGGVMSEFMAGYPWISAYCGDIDITGRRRPASFFRETVFGLRTAPYLTVRPGTDAVQRASSPWAWGDAEPYWTWPGQEGAPVMVEVYSDADEVELVCNGTAVGRVPVGESNGFMGSLCITYQPGELVGIAFRNGSETGRTTLRTASEPSVLSIGSDRDAITADHHDLAFLEITILDDAGEVHPFADRMIHVEIEGPGILQGLGNADPQDDEGFLANAHRTHHGRALAVVRPTGSGTITVSVAAEGLPQARATITAN